MLECHSSVGSSCLESSAEYACEERAFISGSVDPFLDNAFVCCEDRVFTAGSDADVWTAGSFVFGRPDDDEEDCTYVSLCGSD